MRLSQKVLFFVFVLESFAPMAQLVEQLTLNQWVPGSSPGGCTNGEEGSEAPRPRRFAISSGGRCPACPDVLGREWVHKENRDQRKLAFCVFAELWESTRTKIEGIRAS
jgi:hypothetical protein